MPVTNWRWPVEGNIVRTFSSAPSGSKGIDISAPMGESVVAAADGRVVYAGDGLRGYGNLIILEHAGRVLSAYAFASVIKVSEQQQVKQGDVIAEVGARGDEPLLHFEIRQDGRPVDPLSYLPRR
ncbi:peptidoglycan DD-metalloendopeptidase family protein [Salinispirillum sp. LH 10-3-1]|uniref:Peptidoglycan DD-metalloendopeptidase family protein n=2 Tax=Salinispirillum sp. LH 10-3-1 TaxID=2952525 RepID=A0AB38YII1_9GAMM